MTPALQGGAFAGALTSTPTLAAATAKTASEEPAVGYALTYPVGVVLTIVLVSLVLGRKWAAPKDPPPMAGQHLIDLTVEVLHPARMRMSPGSPNTRSGSPTCTGAARSEWFIRTRSSSPAMPSC